MEVVGNYYLLIGKIRDTHFYKHDDFLLFWWSLQLIIEQSQLEIDRTEAFYERRWTYKYIS